MFNTAVTTQPPQGVLGERGAEGPSRGCGGCGAAAGEPEQSLAAGWSAPSPALRVKAGVGRGCFPEQFRSWASLLDQPQASAGFGSAGSLTSNPFLPINP